MLQIMDHETVFAAVSIGNTTTSAGIYVGGSLVRTTRVPTVRMREIWRLFGRAAEDFREKTTACVVGSVVPSLSEAAAEIAENEFAAPARFYRIDVPPGLAIRVTEPDRVGDDRLANALAAYERVKGAVIIVDMGTAITVDAVSDKGEFLGGAILPGARTAAKSLAKQTALLPHIELSGPIEVPGTTTEHAVRAGLLHGIAGGIDRLVEKTRAALGTEAPVIGSGGEAKLLAPLTEHVRDIEPALTLEGLIRAVEALCAADTQEMPFKSRRNR
jgi:type III pantothenate kinase